MAPPHKQENGIPRWMIPVLIALITAIATIGAISIANAATLATRKDAQQVQFQDIKNRLVRIENKLDSLEK